MIIKRKGNNVILALKKTFRKPHESSDPDSLNIYRQIVMDRLAYLLNKLSIHVQFKILPEFDAKDLGFYSYSVDITDLKNDHYFFQNIGGSYFFGDEDPLGYFYLRVLICSRKAGLVISV